MIIRSLFTLAIVFFGVKAHALPQNEMLLEGVTPFGNKCALHLVKRGQEVFASPVFVAQDGHSLEKDRLWMQLRVAPSNRSLFIGSADNSEIRVEVPSAQSNLSQATRYLFRWFHVDHYHNEMCVLRR